MPFVAVKSVEFIEIGYATFRAKGPWVVVS